MTRKPMLLRYQTKGLPTNPIKTKKCTFNATLHQAIYFFQLAKATLARAEQCELKQTCNLLATLRKVNHFIFAATCFAIFRYEASSLQGARCVARTIFSTTDLVSQQRCLARKIDSRNKSRKMVTKNFMQCSGLWSKRYTKSTKATATVFSEVSDALQRNFLNPIMHSEP